MKKHDESFQKKQDNKEQNYRTRIEKSGYSPGNPEKQHADNFLITETPFLPRMKEHADILARIQFAAQRNNFIQQLHRSYGSRYVHRLIESMKVQAKLTVSHPNDIYEQEADRVADIVTSTLNSTMQRQPEEEELLQEKAAIARQSEEEELQMQPQTDHAAMLANDIETRINSARGSGQPLADNIKKPMEQAFGADFNDVHVHTDADSDVLNRQLSARAFTTGQDIFFRDGEYSPGSTDGKHLIAHELTHVIQQSGGRVTGKAVNSEIDMLKQENNAISVQPESLTIQRVWVPTAEDLKLMGSTDFSVSYPYFKLNDFIRYSGLYKLLEGFARSEFSNENIHFLKEIEEYGESPEQAENIWHKYLMKGAPEAINISGSVWTKLRLIYGIMRRRAKTDFEKRTGESGANMRCPICNELVLDSAHVPERSRFNAAKAEVTDMVDFGTFKRFKTEVAKYMKSFV